MYCKNCGNPVDSNAAICVNCGVPVGQGTNYCANCGSSAIPGAAVCTACGAPVGISQNQAVLPGAKSKMAAGLLAIFVGGLGVHNFYLGFTGKGVCQLLMTLLSCGMLTPISSVWSLIEGIMILTGNIDRDADGNLLKD